MSAPASILFVNSVEPVCGVHQFGLNLWRILAKSKQFQFTYTQPGCNEDLLAAIAATDAKLVLYNFYPCTMQWVSLQTLNAVRALGLKQATIFHEVPVTGFDAYLYPDPTFTDRSVRLAEWFSMGRPLPVADAPRSTLHALRSPTIGSAGFGFGWKGHARLVEMVVGEFDKAKVRLHIPFAKHGDAEGEGARATIARCLALADGYSGIELEIDHSFMPAGEFVQWLSENDLNAFLYDEVDTSRGIASTTDHALAARRPIALTSTRMFRHLHHIDGIFVEHSSLKEIMERGVTPLKPVYEQFSDKNVLRGVEQILPVILSGAWRSRRISRYFPRSQNGNRWRSFDSAQDDRGWNRLLTDEDRRALRPTIDWMTAMVPEMMARKIPAANVQQAWALELIWLCKPNRVMCVGCFEDTAFEALRVGSFGVVLQGIDASAGDDLATWRSRNPEARFECVFSISVIEHVADDEAFLRDLCDLLVPDGVCIMTADWKADYQPGDPLPATDLRFYTPADIERLGKILEEKGCYWIDRPDLSGAPDFHYQGHDYSFLALTFKKL